MPAAVEYPITLAAGVKAGSDDPRRVAQASLIKDLGATPDQAATIVDPVRKMAQDRLMWAHLQALQQQQAQMRAQHAMALQALLAQQAAFQGGSRPGQGPGAGPAEPGSRGHQPPVIPTPIPMPFPMGGF